MSATTTQVIQADSVVAGGELFSPGWVEHVGGIITEVGSGTHPSLVDTADQTDAQGISVERVPGTILPGFVDMHGHGGGGASFSTATPEAVATVTATHLVHGTTSMLASLVTEPLDVLARQVSMLADLAADGVVAGIHLEGPFLSAARCGAHDPALLRDPTREAVAPLLAAGRGTVRMMTLAPEREDGLQAVRMLVDAGVVAAVGHTDAASATCVAAFDAGARVATHLFNGMRRVQEQHDGGPIAASLLDERVVVEVILDGVHVARESMELVRRLAGGRIALITDAMSAAGAGDGDFLIGALPVRVSGGVAVLVDGSTLAGSTLTQDAALARLVRDHGASLVEASRALSGTPAQVLGLDHVGELRAGLRADLVVLADLTVTRVMRGGEWVA